MTSPNQHIELIARAEMWLEDHKEPPGWRSFQYDLIRDLKHALEETLTKEK